MLYASVIEFIHTATLVHDDIIDESELRRGRDAVHTRWGNHVTVLFGDFLYLKSMSLALTPRHARHHPAALRRDAADRRGRDLPADQERRRGSQRRRALRHRPAQDGVSVRRLAQDRRHAGADTREQQEALWDYGLNIGMAFQIVDDLLDFTGEQVALGKPVGGDLREGKMTLPVIHLLYARRRRAARAAAALSMRARCPLDEWREIRSLLAQARSIDYAQRAAADFVERAKKALHAFPPSDARDALMYLPDYVVSRDR